MIDMWFLDVDGTVSHVTVESRFVSVYVTGITYSSDDGWWIFQPWSRILRISGTSPAPYQWV